jgi:peptide/nickel transport system permease protein
VQIFQGGPHPLTGFIFRKCLEALSLVLGVVLVLLLVFESGVLGDPALLEVGEHAEYAQVADARVRLGIWRAWDATALAVTGPGLALQGGPDALKIRGPEGAWTGIPLGGLSIEDLARELEKASQGRMKVEVAKNPERSASGILTAWQGDILKLDDGAFLGWAEPVAIGNRFLNHAGDLLAFDFGMSRDGQAIGPQLKERGLRSLALALPAFILTTLFALALALLGATLLGRSDRFLMVASAVGMAISSLAWLLFLRGWLAGDLGWFPIAGWSSPYIPYLALPVLIWVVVSIWPDLRLYRTVLLEQATGGHLRAARAKGLGRWGVAFKHLLPGAMVPILTQVLAALPFLFLGSLLLERVFTIPGLGGWTVDAVMTGDQAVLRAIVFLSALAWIAAQWAADILCLVVDPRMRRIR